MTNEEKADELSKKGFKDFNNPYTRVTVNHIKNCCIEMAQWKDEQFKEQNKLTWKEVKYIIELDGDIETDNFMGSDEYYQAIADKANVMLFGLQGKLG